MTVPRNVSSLTFSSHLVGLMITAKLLKAVKNNDSSVFEALVRSAEDC